MSLGYPVQKRGFRLPRVTLPILIGLGVFVALVLVALANLPRVTATSPGDDALRIAPRAPVEITFSRPMARAMVEDRVRITPDVDGIWQWDGNTLRFIPLGPWPRNETITVQLRAGAFSRLGLPLLQGANWSFAIDAARVAYLLTEVDGQAEIWAVLLDGSSPAPLTDTPLGVYEFSVAPDGSAAYYAGARADGGADLMRLDLVSGDTTVVRDCAPASCRRPAISPTGQYLAYEQRVFSSTTQTYERAGLALYDFEAGVNTALPFEGAVLHSPTWASSEHLAFVDEVERRIGVYQLLTTEMVYVPDNTNQMGSWATGGPTLIYAEIDDPGPRPTSTPAPTPTPTAPIPTATIGPTPTGTIAPAGTPAFTPTPPNTATPTREPTPTPRATAIPSDILSASLYRYDVSTDTRRVLTQQIQVEDTHPAISPDGQWIVFARRALQSSAWTPGRQAWLMRADGSDARPLTDDPVYTHSSFVWSPDSSTIVFVKFDVADINRPSEIWAIDRDGENLRRLVVGGVLPRWLP